MYMSLQLIGKHIIVSLFFFAIHQFLDFFLENRKALDSIIIRDEQSLFFPLLYSFIISSLCFYVLYKNIKFDAIYKLSLIYFIFYVVVFMLNYDIYDKIYAYLNDSNSKLYRTEKAVITQKKAKRTEHKGGGRGGAYSHTTYAIYYRTTSGRASNIVYSGQYWEKFNRGDSIVFRYYKGIWQDYHIVKKIE